MPWLRTFLIFFLLLVLTLSGCGVFSERSKETEPDVEKADLPAWLKLSHREIDIFNLDNEPLEFEDSGFAAGENGATAEQNTSSDAARTGPIPNPTGSPYKAGTLADMIWQQKQKDFPGASGSGSKPEVRGSPYKPGTLADMIWKQKQKDLQ